MQYRPTVKFNEVITVIDPFMWLQQLYEIHPLIAGWIYLALFPFILLGCVLFIVVFVGTAVMPFFLCWLAYHKAFCKESR